MNGKEIKLIRKKLGLTQQQFAEKLNYSLSTVQKWENGAREIDEFNAGVIKQFENEISNIHQKTAQSINLENKVIEHRGVPYFDNIDGTATITTSFSDYPETPAFYIDYEHFNDCDAYIQVVGDSMYPAYSSGEIIAVKRIMNFDVIQWGEVYFVVTNGNANDMKTVKQLHFHEDLDKIILRSSNPNYKGDTVVKKKDILYLYIVKGKIRRNQL